MRDSWWLIFQTSGSKVYWAFATLLTSVVTARYLGPEGRGVLVAALGWVTLFSTFGHLSLGQVIIHAATKARGEDWLPRVAGSAMALMAAVTILGWTVATFGYLASEGRMFQHIPPRVLMLAMAALPLMLWMENGNGMLLSLDRLPVMNLAQAAGGTATLLFSFLALDWLRLRVGGALVAILLAQAITVAISAGYLFRRIRMPVVTRAAARMLLTGGAKLHMNAVGTYLFSQASILILNHHRSPGETAFYQLAVQLMTGIQIVPLAVSAVTYSLAAKLGPDRAWPGQRRLLMQVSLLMLVLAVLAYFVAPPVIVMVFGPQFLPTVPLFRILLIGVPGMTLSMVMASQWIARGFFLQAAGVTLLLGALTVAANLQVVSRYGASGVTWVAVGTWILAMGINLMMFVWVERVSRRELAR